MQNIYNQRIRYHIGGAKSQGVNSTDLVHLKYLKMVYFAYSREINNPDNYTLSGLFSVLLLRAVIPTGSEIYNLSYFCKCLRIIDFNDYMAGSKIVILLTHC